MSEHSSNSSDTSNNHADQVSLNQTQQVAMNPWRALSPWAMVSFVFNTFRLLVNNAYAVLPFVYTGWNQGFDSPWVIGAVLFASLSIILFALGTWLKFSYRIQNHQLDIRRGIIFKKTAEIPFNKIQNVRLQQPFYLRPLKLYSLVVETAGSKKDEAELSAIGYRQALRLKRQLLSEQHISNDMAANQAKDSSTSTSQAKTSNQPEVSLNRSIKQLAQFGFYQNNAIWLAVILGPVLGQFEWESLFEYELINSSLEWYQAKTQNNQLIQTGIVGITLVLCYLIFALISIISALLKYHPYRLTLAQQTLHRSGGIIAKQNDALKLRRIQVLRFNQPFLGRLLKLWTLSFKQVQGNEVESRGQHMLVPSMSKQDINTLLPKLTGLACQSQQIPSKFSPIHQIWFWRRAAIVVVFGLVAATIFSETTLSSLVLIATLVVIARLYLRFRQWGYVIDDQDIWLHSGFLGQTWHCIPSKKVQHIALVQTPGQKKRNLANIEIGLASGLLAIPSINYDIASQISENILGQISLDHQNWI